MEFPYIELKYSCPHCDAIQIVEYKTIPESLSCKNCNRKIYSVRHVRGLIYVASNPSMPGLLKIGLTSRNSTIRLKELAEATGVPTPLECEFVSDNPEVDESRIHNKLSEYKIPNKEFFGVNRDIAIRVCEEVCERSPKTLRHIEPPKEPEVLFRNAITNNGKLYCPECESRMLRVSKKRGWGCKKCQFYFNDSGEQIPDPRK